jgi:hypothetical protein
MPGKQRGFVLLFSLWVLLGGVLLVGGMSMWSAQRARESAALLQAQQVEARLESAAHELSFRLLLLAQSPLHVAQSGLSSSDVQGVRSQVQAVHGLLDLNHAERGDLALVMRAVGVEDAESKVGALIGRRPLQSYAMLSAAGLDETEIRCLLRHVTLSSGMPRPMPELATQSLRSALRLAPLSHATEASNPASVSPVVGEVRASGNGFRYWLGAAGNREGVELVVEVQLTGRTESPVQVLEWYWLPGRGERARPCRD